MSPVIAPGCESAVELNAKDKLTGEALTHGLLADTIIVPFTALHEKSTPILWVPLPDDTVAPDGTDHV